MLGNQVEPMYPKSTTWAIVYARCQTKFALWVLNFIIHSEACALTANVIRILMRKILM